MSADRVGWWAGHQFGIVPRACIEAIVAQAEQAEHVSGLTSVAVFTALSVAAGRDGAADGGMAGAARMLGMNPGVVRRTVAACLEPAGVATRGPGGVVLHLPDDAEQARRGARPPTPIARPTARSNNSKARPTARPGAATPSPSTEKPTEPPCSPPGQLALADSQPPAARPEQHRAVGHMLGSDRDMAFAEFWASYPRRAGKGAARLAWAKARRKGVLPEVIVAGARQYAADPNRTEQFTAHPATWLNQERWDDDPLPARGPTSTMGRTVNAFAQVAAAVSASSAPAALGPAPREAPR